MTKIRIETCSGKANDNTCPQRSLCLRFKKKKFFWPYGPFIIGSEGNNFSCEFFCPATAWERRMKK
jgi:hypothetical protein